MKKRILSLLLATLMVLSMVACSTNNGTPADGETTAPVTGSTEDGSKELVKLKMLCLPSNTSGVIDGWLGKLLAERVGVEIELLPAGDQGEQKLLSMMASGELCDIVVFKENKPVQDAIYGNMLVNMEDYKEYMPDVYANIPQVIQYAKDNVSNGTNGFYALPSSIGPNVPSSGPCDPGSFVRYDYYKEIGSPEIHTLEDWLPVMKEMLEKHPTNEDGQKNYGFTFWTDWDTSYARVVGNICRSFGKDYPQGPTLVEIDYNNSTPVVSSMMDENSFYFRVMKFLYDANQMGLVDPDYLTQRAPDAMEKVGQGRIMMSFGPWGSETFNSPERTSQKIGYVQIPYVGQKGCNWGAHPLGRAWYYAISSAAEHPEKCAEFINYIYSNDGYMECTYGPRGEAWDLDDSNQPYLTEKGYQLMADPNLNMNDGNPITKSLSGYLVASPYDNNAKNSKDNYYFWNFYWQKPDYAPAKTALEEQWSKDYGAPSMLEYALDRDMITFIPYSKDITATDEMELIISRCGDVIKTLSYQMIFASNEDEFNALKAEMIEKCKGLGCDKYLEWYKTEFAAAREFGEKYSK